MDQENPDDAVRQFGLMARALPHGTTELAQIVGVSRQTLQGWLLVSEGRKLKPRYPGRQGPTPRQIAKVRALLEAHIDAAHTALGAPFSGAIATVVGGKTGVLFTLAAKKKVSHFVPVDEAQLDELLGGLARRRAAFADTVNAESVSDDEIPTLREELEDCNYRLV